jgi:hypothetical protein
MQAMNSKHNPDLLDFVSQTAAGKYHYVIHCFAEAWWVEDRLSGRRTAVFRYPEGVDKDTISDWFNSWLDLYFTATDTMETEERQNFTEAGNGSMTGSA